MSKDTNPAIGSENVYGVFGPKMQTTSLNYFSAVCSRFSPLYVRTYVHISLSLPLVRSVAICVQESSLLLHGVGEWSHVNFCGFFTTANIHRSVVFILLLAFRIDVSPLCFFPDSSRTHRQTTEHDDMTNTIYKNVCVVVNFKRHEKRTGN